MPWFMSQSSRYYRDVITLEVAVAKPEHRSIGHVRLHTERFLCLNQADVIELEPNVFKNARLRCSLAS
jgi:hypothetical protein